MISKELCWSLLWGIKKNHCSKLVYFTDCLFPGEMWIGITLAVLVEVVPTPLRTLGVAVYLFIISNIGGNMPLVVSPLQQMFLRNGISRVDSLRGRLILYCLFVCNCAYSCICVCVCVMAFEGVSISCRIVVPFMQPVTVFLSVYPCTHTHTHTCSCICGFKSPSEVQISHLNHIPVPYYIYSKTHIAHALGMFRLNGRISDSSEVKVQNRGHIFSFEL